MNADVVKALILRLSWQLPVWVLASFCLAVALIYFLQTRPIVDAESQRLEMGSLQQVVNKTEILTSQIERILLTTQGWAKEGTLSVDDVEGFNRIMIPVLNQRALVSSVHIAQESGRELLLLRAPYGVWKNRVSDVAIQGKQQRWLEWSEDRKKISEELKTQDYDPRQRPWFKEAMSGNPGEIRWTQPYVFQTTQEPGISVSVRWLHPKTGESQIFAFDVLLTDLSNFTQGLVHAKQGHVALMTMDGRVLGLPHHPAFAAEADIKRSVLKEPSQIGLSALAVAVQRWRDSGTQAASAFSMDVDTQTWRAAIRSLPVRNIQFLVVAMAPQADFSPWSTRVLVVFGLLLLGEGVFTFLLFRKIRRSIYRPVHSMVENLDRLNRGLALDARVSAVTAEMVVRIQAVQGYAELAHVFLSGISNRLSVGLASFYRADAAEKRLLLCGGYARAGSAAPAELKWGEGLVGQVATERKVLVVKDPPANYCVIESGLATLPAKVLLIVPVISNLQLRGIFEIAFVEDISDVDVRWIEGLLPTLAMAMEIIERQEQMKPLQGASNPSGA